MKISFDWLKEYINFDIDINEAARILTDTGLEVESIDEGISGPENWDTLIVGEVLSKDQHPNADRLSCLKVAIGNGDDIAIVCGAPNVDAGQKVVLAQVGTVFNNDKGDSLKIKKSKIRGEESFGMLCSEVELGIGTDNSGIMVLDSSIATGTSVKEIVNSSTGGGSLEIGLTPNRSDATSHIGVARDLIAAISLEKEVELVLPSVEAFKVTDNSLPVEVTVEDNNACPRYSGVTISDIKIEESPSWLKTRLLTIGLKPINNVVDITNFVLHETGQPLHAFDYSKIEGGKVVVKKFDSEVKFETLDGVERKITPADLMICNVLAPMCIAGVFGGSESGVSDSTTSIFLESAYFNPVSVRKTAKRHGLNTDASFRFERGADPNITLFALKRAAILITEICGGKVSSEIVDIYPNPISDFEIEFSYKNCDRLIGKSIERETIKKIFRSLEIVITSETEEGLSLSVPPLRADVIREVDLIEEVLRIYGYNNIEDPAKMNSSLVVSDASIQEKIQDEISDMLGGNGFKEIMSNSLTKADYYSNKAGFNANENVEMLNPLSSDLNVLRKTLVFGGLEAVAYNVNRKYDSLKLYEFGSVYQKEGEKYKEERHLLLLSTGNTVTPSWNASKTPVDYFFLKGIVSGLFTKLGFQIEDLMMQECNSSLFAGGVELLERDTTLASIGRVNESVLKEFGISQNVIGCTINWTNLLKASAAKSIKYKQVPKFPGVQRDLAIVISPNITFADLRKACLASDNKILKDITLFDLYIDKKDSSGNKSCGLRFKFQDEKQTLTDEQVQKVMDKIFGILQSGKINATIKGL
ncbi:MAG: phenylalanine--tRNA ligase subunit beta [Flavobacteriales bacterium]|nr:phenylalanine--tRNA ligase subunit beta [Flavobacteriales bacterium]